MKTRITFLLGGVALFLSSCTQEPARLHAVADTEGFKQCLLANYDGIMRDVSVISQDSLRRRIGDAHKELQGNYPILYDWWLQDGEQVNWFTDNFASQLSNRMKKHQLTSDADVNKSLDTYINACVKRREARLARFSKETPEVVFTKFRVFRPSFFAYTEGLSDARNERCYLPGTELARLKMDGIWASETSILKDSSGVIRDPEVHFDGRDLLFSWKKSLEEDDYHIYEMDLASGKMKQLTSGLGFADIEGIYLPNDDILFNSTRCGTSVDCWYTEVSNLYTCNREGNYMRRLGFDQVHTVAPALLSDGRVVYTRWDYNDRGQVFTQPLFQMNPDGTGQAEYYGLNSWFPTTATHPRQIPGTRKIMATVTGHHSPQHGKLAIIDPEAGRDENQGVMFVAPMRQPKAERIDSYGQYGEQFQYPEPLNEKEFLVSYSPTGYDAPQPMYFGIYWMTTDGERELLIADNENSCNQPRLLAKRERPFERATTVDYNQPNGVYYMQNVYAGNGLEGIEPGTVKQLRVVELEFRSAGVGMAFNEGKGGGSHASSPVGVGNAAWDIKKVHGTVDVYEDGSAFFEVPARMPLYFQALDSNGYVVQTMRSWSTLQPGEVQSCVGCHEHKNSVPLTNHATSIAMNKGIQGITPSAIYPIIGFSFQEQIQPILDNHCVSCHDGSKQKMSLTGDLKVIDQQTKRKYSEAYLNLTHARKTTEGNDSWQGNAEHPEVNWVSAMSEPTLLKPYSAGAATSNLVTRLKKGHGNTKITPEEIDKIALWIDLLVPFVGDYKEANNWSVDELKFYDYYQSKRTEAEAAEKEAVRAYMQSLTL